MLAGTEICAFIMEIIWWKVSFVVCCLLLVAVIIFLFLVFLLSLWQCWGIDPVPILYAEGGIVGSFNHSTYAPFSIQIQNNTLYLLFTPAGPPPNPPKNLHIPIIVGSVVGGVVLITIIVGIIIWRRKVVRNSVEYTPILNSKH